MARTTPSRAALGLVWLGVVTAGVLGLVVGLAGHSKAAGTCTIYWTGRSTNDWSAAGNWSSTDGGPSAGRTPTSADAVCMSSAPRTAAVSLSATVTIGTLSWPKTSTVSPTLTNSGSLTLGSSSLAGASTLYGLLETGTVTTASKGSTRSTLAMTTLNLSGSLVGPGSFSASGATTLDGGTVDDTTLLVSGSGSVTSDGLSIRDDSAPATLEVAGTLSLADNADVAGNTGSTVLVDAGGVVSYAGTSASMSADIRTATVTNAGTISATGGTFDLRSAGTDTGTLSAAAGATLDIGGARTENGATVSGAGSLVVDGSLLFTTTSSHLPLTGPLVVSGSLTAPSGVTVTLPSLTLTGTLDGPGTFVISGSATVSEGGVDSGVVKLLGTVTITPLGWALRDDNGPVTVEVAGTLVLQDSADVHGGSDSTVLVDSGGTVRFAGSDAQQQAYLDTATVTDDGTIDTAEGTFFVQGAGTDTGTFTTAAGATLDLDDDRTENAGAAFSGAGTVLVNHVLTVASQQVSITDSGPLVVAGALVVDSGIQLTLPMLEVTGELDGPGTVTVTGPTTLDTAIVADTSLLLRGATEVGSADLFDDTTPTSVEVAGALTLDDDGGISGDTDTSLLVDAGGSVAYAGPDTGSLDVGNTTVRGTVAVTGGTLEIHQLGNLSASGVLTGGTYLASGGTLALDHAVTTDAATISVGSAGTVTGNDADLFSTITGNNGVLTVGRTETLGHALANTGTVTVGAGTVTVPSYSQSAGGTTVAGGATLKAASSGTGTVAIGGGVLTGNGTVAGAVSGAGTVMPGRAAGPLTIGATYSMKSASTLAVGVSGPAAAGTDFGQLSVGGTAALGGTLAITTAGGYVPPVGTTYPILTAGRVTGTFASVTGATVGTVRYVVSYTPTSVRLTVQAAGGSFTVTGISPATVAQGASSVAVKISGSGFATTGTTTVTISGAGVTAKSVKVKSAGQITAKLTVTASAATGARDVTVTQGSTSVTCTGCLMIGPAR